MSTAKNLLIKNVYKLNTQYGIIEKVHDFNY